jgi:predicted RNase H-like nuclease
MRFIGVDLAWADSAVANETGVVALDEDGTIVAAGWTAGVAATTAWLEANAGEEAIPVFNLGCPTRATVRGGSKAEPRPGSQAI